MERICLASGVDAGHRVVLYTYGKVTQVPECIETADAREIIPEKDLNYYGRSAGPGAGSPAVFANWFRYELLLRYEGIWIDTDYCVLRQFPEFDSYLYGWERPGIVGSALLGRRGPDVALIENLLDVCRHPYRPRSWDTWKSTAKKSLACLRSNGSRGEIPWGTTGPVAVTGVLSQMGLVETARNIEDFYPVTFDNWARLFDDTAEGIEELVSGSYGVHLWNEMIRRSKIDKYAEFNPNSWLHRQEQRLGLLL